MNFVQTLVQYFSHLLWPQSCPACGAIGVSHCDACLAETVEDIPLFCLDCGGAYGVPCCDCFIPCRALTQHEGLSRDFLLRFKYHGAKAVGEAMGRLMARSADMPDADLLVPVPLHVESGRPYNQSERIACGMSSVWGIPVTAAAVRWRRNVGRQMGRGGRERRAIPRNALYAEPKLVTGRRIILVDDVYTTGATLRAMRRVIDNAGGQVIGAYVWARRLQSAEGAPAWRGLSLEDADDDV